MIEILLAMLNATRGNQNAQAIILQSYIAEYGPLSEDEGNKVIELLEGGADHGRN